MYLYVIIIIGVSNVMCASKKLHNATLTDISQCKVTQLGNEYHGSIHVTAGGIRCQSWFGEHQIHKVDRTIKDVDFADGSMREARNYCRNPTRSPKGPWCYTTDTTLIHDECDIPLCNYGECRITGTGAEYGGSHKISSAGNECQSWDKRHKKAGGGHVEKFASKNFPDKSRSVAKNFCRNPDDSSGGPWCYIENSHDDTVHKEYCDVPFCDDKDCLVFTRETSLYSIITKLNKDLGNITFWIKLWNPSDGHRSAARLLLSHLPIPTSAKKIAQEWGAGAEIFISNIGSGLIYPNPENDLNLEPSPRILISTKWTGVSVVWGGGLITVSTHDSSQPLFIAEYGKNNTITNLHIDSFMYYGLIGMGSGVLWSTEFCQHICEVHTTFGMDHLRMWPLRKANGTYDIHFYVRANQKIVVQLYQNPGTTYPYFMITIKNSNTIILTYQESAEVPQQQLQEVSSANLLDYWIWKEFVITIVGPYLQVFSQKQATRDEILYAKNELYSMVKWFSIGSDATIAHWTLFCAPTESDMIPPIGPPDCITNPADSKYIGTHWITESDKPCIPWYSKDVPITERSDHLFPDGTALSALNNCRNLRSDIRGPYCYAIPVPHRSVIEKQYCVIRKCKSWECRMAGTGNDYIGTVTVTRSNRTCSLWMKPLSLYPTKIKPIHPIDPNYLNDTLFAEQSARGALNYCRDPSRSIAGPWCYTTDPMVPQDLCNVLDCDQPEECMFLVKGDGIDRRHYVLPEQRTEGIMVNLKIWEADNPDTITWTFTADVGLKSRYILKIGASNNEEVLLYYQAEEGALELVMNKTLPHLLYIGKWSKFIIKVPRGMLKLYYDGASTPIFEWSHPDPLRAFLPIYYHYKTESGRTIGVSFDCSSRCSVEITETMERTKILPVAMRRTFQSSTQEFSVIFRGWGVAQVALFLFPESNEYYSLRLGDGGPYVEFLKNTPKAVLTLHKWKAPVTFIFAEGMWTNITVRWYNSTIELARNDLRIFQYKHTHPLLFYFYTMLIEEGGWLKWSANCRPPDLDGSPVDGGWSEWSPWACSVSCNGGVGTRKRICNNPPANIRGEPCMGPDTMSGRCNTIRCGDLTEDTYLMIKRGIKKNYTALIVDEGQAVTITSDRDIIERVNNESLDMELKWSHNGIFIEPDSERVIVENYDIVIKQAQLNDSGVYCITLQRLDETYLILKVVTLAVTPINTILILRETTSLQLNCYATVLGYLYADLRVSWLINDKVWKDYGVTMPITVDRDEITLNTTHQGNWQCVVRQDDFNFRWITNVMKLRIIGAPNWRTHLMEDPLTRPLFGLMPNETVVVATVVIIIVLFILCCCTVTWCIVKYQEHLKGGMSRYLKNEKSRATRENVKLIKN